MPEAFLISMPTQKDDQYWHKSLDCVFEEINDQAEDSVSLLLQLRPDVIRELNHHPSSMLHGEILRFIDENCGPVDANATQWTCTWAKIYSIVRVLNRNNLVLDCSDEDVKSEDESSIHEEQDEQEDIPIYQNKKIEPIDGYFSKECQEVEDNTDANLVEDYEQPHIEKNKKDDLKRENSIDSFVEELERMDMIKDTV